MLRYRMIPTLLLHNNGLYKTVKYNINKGKYVGDPINAIKIFNDKGVDELIFLDIDSSKNNSEPNYELIKNISTECFMPLAYGGGIKSIEQIKKISRIGIEKIVLNSVLFENPHLLMAASNHFGSQSIVAAIDLKKNIFGKYCVYNSAKRQFHKIGILEYIKQLEEFGAGEIYVSFVDLDGTFSGFNIQLLKKITDATDLPVIVVGGAKDLKDFSEAIIYGGASAVSAGSMFVFKGPHKAVLISYPSYEELEKELKRIDG